MEVLILLIFAYACGLLKSLTIKQSLGAKSSQYTGCPVTKAIASFLMTPFPTLFMIFTST